LFTGKRRKKGDLDRAVDAVVERAFQRAAEQGLSAEQTTHVYTKAIDEATAPLVEGLLRRAPGMLRNRKRVRRGFERRLARRWAKALDLFEVVLEVAREAGSEFNSKYRAAAAAENDYLFETRLHARACATASEVHALLRTGHPEAAYARWRTLQELAVASGIVAQGGQHLAERYLLHEVVEQAADARAYQRHASALGYEELGEDELKRHEQARRAVVQRFGIGFERPYGWASSLFEPPHVPTFAELEEQANLARMRPWYRRASHGVHAGAKGGALVIHRRGPYRTLLTGPTNAFLADPGHGALICLNQVTTALLLQSRTGELEGASTRLLIAKALLQLTDLAGAAFLRAHQKLQADEARIWAADLSDAEMAMENSPSKDQRDYPPGE
jgi:hypothetical protein